MSIIKTSKVFTKNRKCNTRIIVNEGSSRSTKTYSIIQLLISKALQRKCTITACRSRLTWLKATAYLDFLTILESQFDLYDPKCLNKTELVYTFPNKSTFRFLGLDEAQKLHGYKGDILWLNEAMEVERKSFTQLAMRTTEQIIIDYNPSAEQHWIYDSVIPRDDCTFIKSTYKDNPFLEKAIVEEIERLEPTPENIAMGTADEVSWKIYGLGERASHRGLIFSDTDIVRCLPPKEEWKKHFYGLDFGFTNDPSCLTLVVLAHGELYFKELFYEKGLVNRKNDKKPEQKSIEQRLEDHNIPKDSVIWADSAEPKSIQEISNAGWFNIRAVHKGPDSVINGIKTIKRYKSHITEDSMNGIKEKNNYKWQEDKKGEPTNKPIDNWNHFWDAVRYPVMMEFRLEYEEKYVATSPNAMPKKGNTLEEKLKYYNARRENEVCF